MRDADGKANSYSEWGQDSSEFLFFTPHHFSEHLLISTCVCLSFAAEQEGFSVALV